MRQTHIVVCFLIFIIPITNALFASPSGGPYGPVAQSFELPSAQRLYFVSPDGDASSPGTALQHPTTIESAIIRAQTGDAIILREGLYRTGSLRFNQGILIQPYRDELPVFSGTLPATNWDQTSDGLWQTKWNRLFPAAPADWWRPERHRDTTPLHRFNYDMVFADGIRLESAGEKSEVSENSYFIDYENRTVFIGFDPALHSIEITAHDSALVRTMRPINGRRNDSTGPTIKGIRFEKYARLALLIEGIEPQKPMDPSDFGNEVVGTTLEHLTIQHCSRVAGYFRGNQFTMRHCLVSDCGTEGIYVINSSDVLLERNIVTKTNSHTPIMGYFASAVKIFNQSFRVTCRDNLIIDNPNASGIWYDVGNRESLVVDNWIERTGDGAFFEISEDATCAGNVFVECNPGVRILNSADIRVFQNTFYNSQFEVLRDMRSSEEGDHFGWHASTGPAVSDRDRHVACNNLFIADAALDPGIIRVMEHPEMSRIARNEQLKRLDGNVYVRPKSDLSPLFLEGARGISHPEETFASYRSLSDLQSKYPLFEVAGRDFADYPFPAVRNAMLKRFELRPTFPGKTVGVVLPDSIKKILQLEAEDTPFPGAWPL